MSSWLIVLGMLECTGVAQSGVEEEEGFGFREYELHRAEDGVYARSGSEENELSGMDWIEDALTGVDVKENGLSGDALIEDVTGTGGVKQFVEDLYGVAWTLLGFLEYV